MKILRHHFKSRQAFTLIELLVVVTVIGILASLSLSAFHGYLLRSKAAEASVALNKIIEGEVEYYHKNQSFLAAGPTNIPPAPVGPTAVDFGSDPRWKDLSFAIGPTLYFGYQADLISTTQVNCEAMADLTGDGITSLYRRSISASGSDINVGGIYIFDELE